MNMLNLPQSAQKIINKLKKAGFEAYAVGGSVRDLLMKRKSRSWDFTTNATPKKILKLFPDSFYDNKFGTVGVKIKDKKGEVKDIYEITTYRTESGYSDHRHPNKVSWGKSLEQDLSRRDFTINAIAFDGKNIVDPYQGQKDLKQKLVRAVGHAEKRFNEDSLRLMRAVRIATELGFMIEDKTFQAIKKLANLIHLVSADRIRTELMLIIACKYPADGIRVLRNTNLLNEILPELEKAFGVPQQSPKRHHIYDVGTHLVKSLENCPSKDPVVRLATLLHDIGKPITFRKDEQTNIITFHNHEMTGTSMTRNIARRLNFSKKDRDRLVKLVRWHQFSVDEKQTDKALRRFIKRVGKENLQDIIDLRIGDRLGGGALETSWRMRLFLKRLEEVQKQPFAVSDLKISGHDVMNKFKIGSTPQVGKILNQLFDEVVLEKIKNTKKDLQKRLNEIHRELKTT